jgi:hypothetical protein
MNAEKIDLNLLAKTLQWKTGQGTKDRYPSIVDQPEKPLLSYHFFNSRCHLIHRIRIGHIKDEWDILPTATLRVAMRAGPSGRGPKASQGRNPTDTPKIGFVR